MNLFIFLSALFCIEIYASSSLKNIEVKTSTLHNEMKKQLKVWKQCAADFPSTWAQDLSMWDTNLSIWQSKNTSNNTNVRSLLLVEDFRKWAEEWPASRLLEYIETVLILLDNSENFSDQKFLKFITQQNKIFTTKVSLKDTWLEEWSAKKNVRSPLQLPPPPPNLLSGFYIFSWKNILIKIIEIEYYRRKIGNTWADYFTENSKKKTRDLVFILYESLRINGKFYKGQFPIFLSDWYNDIRTDKKVFGFSKSHNIKKKLSDLKKNSHFFAFGLCSTYLLYHVISTYMKVFFSYSMLPNITIQDQSVALNDFLFLNNSQNSSFSTIHTRRHNYGDALSVSNTGEDLAAFLLKNYSLPLITLLFEPPHPADVCSALLSRTRGMIKHLAKNLSEGQVCEFSYSTHLEQLQGGCQPNFVNCSSPEFTNKTQDCHTHEFLAAGSIRIKFGTYEGRCSELIRSRLPQHITPPATITHFLETPSTPSPTLLYSASPTRLHSVSPSFSDRESFSQSIMPSPSLPMSKTRSSLLSVEVSRSNSDSYFDSLTNSLSNLITLSRSNSDMETSSWSFSSLFTRSHSETTSPPLQAIYNCNCSCRMPCSATYCYGGCCNGPPYQEANKFYVQTSKGMEYAGISQANNNASTDLNFCYFTRTSTYQTGQWGPSACCPSTN